MYNQCFSDKTVFNHNYLILLGFNSHLIIFSSPTIYIVSVLSLSSGARGHYGTVTSHQLPVKVIRGTSRALVSDLQVFALNTVKMLEQLIVIHLSM